MVLTGPLERFYPLQAIGITSAKGSEGLLMKSVCPNSSYVVCDHRHITFTRKTSHRLARMAAVFVVAFLIVSQSGGPHAARFAAERNSAHQDTVSTASQDGKDRKFSGDIREEPRRSQAEQGAARALSNLPSVPEDAYWDKRFARPGPDGTVVAVATDGNNVYVGGNFSRIGGIQVSQIAKWNGSQWSALGTGVTGVVQAIAVSGNNVYFGTGSQLYVWNGHTVEVLGGGVVGINAIAVSGSDVYVGGSFTDAGGVSATRIAKWNGSTWSALGSGMPATVRAIAINGSDVYAGGDFMSAGGVSANGIARWDGTSWHALGDGVTGCVNCLPQVFSVAVNGADVYVGGRFNTAGGVSAVGIAKWNGISWSSLGSGIPGFVYSIAISAADIVAAGEFTTAGGISANRIARWNGSAWFALGGGVTGEAPNQSAVISAIAINGSNIYVGGDFWVAGSVNARALAHWDGGSWSKLGVEVSNGLNSLAYTMAVSGNDLYVGGTFIRAGDINVNHIAKWNGGTWATLGGGVTGVASTVFALAASGGDLYVGGVFNTAGSVSASGIAKWDGNSWSALGSGVNGAVYAIAVNGSDVYVGGFFSTAGGVAANGLAKWDGSNWSPVGAADSFGSGAYVYSVATRGSDVYVGGVFDQVGGVAVNNIAKWNGANWSALGAGLSGSVYKIVLDGSNLYAGGTFNQATGAPANLLARWDGNTWSSLGSGLGGNCGPDVTSCTPAVISMVLSNGTLYAGGHFTIAGGISANLAARWDGTNWSALGSGIYPGFDFPDLVYDLAVTGSDLYVCGSFVIAGAKRSDCFARWNDCPLSLAPTSAAFPAEGGNGSVNVTSQNNCPVTADSNANWIVITSPSSPAASTFTYSVAANTTNNVRIGSITIGNTDFTVYQAPQISDVTSSDPFYLEISKVYARGISVGCGNGNFCPNDPVTREQMSAFIMRAKGEFNPPTPASQRFNDVKSQNVFYNFIDRLAVLQITLGCTPDHLLYCPSDPVKRDQMAAFILRGLGEFNPPTPASQRFSDVPSSNLFYNFIDRLAVLNITLGCTPDHVMYCPGDSVTRAQMAAFLVRAFNL